MQQKHFISHPDQTRHARSRIKLLQTRLGLFERWITLSTGQIAIQRIVWFVLSTLIHWIAIYPVDSVIQTLNNRGQQSWTIENANHLVYTRALRWFSSFSPEVKRAQSSLHWDCISFCRLPSEWKPVPRKHQYVKQKEKRQNMNRTKNIKTWPSLVFCPGNTKRRPKAPAKT